jgi:hypothetical protein
MVKLWFNPVDFEWMKMVIQTGNLGGVCSISCDVNVKNRGDIAINDPINPEFTRFKQQRRCNFTNKYGDGGITLMISQS